MMQSNNNNKLRPIDPIDQYIKEIPESLHDIIYCWDRPHQLFRNMIDEKKDMNIQKDFDIKPRKIEVHELEWLEQVLNENAFLRAKKLQERKLLYQVSKIILLEESQDILFRQGDESTSYFIVLHGELNCIVSTDNEGESAADIYASSRVKTKKMFSTKRAMKNQKKKKIVVHGQRVGGHIKEKDLHGVIVGTFIAGNSFGETALTKTKHGLHRRASVIAKKPSILLRIGTKEYIKVQRKWKSLKLKLTANFLSRLDFLKHWPKQKIYTLAENACSLIVFHKNEIVQKKNDPILYMYIIVSGALRKMQKFPHRKNTILETKKAFRGDLICCNEWIHHVTHSSFAIITAAEFFKTEVIRLNQNGFLMIQKDEIAFNKMCEIVKANEYLKYYEITEKHKLIDNQNVLVRQAHPTSSFKKDNELRENWKTFRRNLSSTVKAIPTYDEQINLKLKIAKQHHKVNSYLDKKMKRDGGTYHLTQLRLLVASRSDDKTNNENKQLFETLAKKIDDKKDEDDEIIDTTHKEEENEQKKTTIRLKRLGAARKAVTIRSPEPPSNQSSNSNLQFRLKSPNSYNSHRIILNRNIWSSQSSSPIEMSRSNKLML